MSLLYVFKYNSLDENIFNKKWYKYNINTGYYDVINITNDSFSYLVPTNDNESNSYDKCSKYNYNSKKKELVLNCNKKIIIKEIIIQTSGGHIQQTTLIRSVSIIEIISQSTL